MYYICTMCSNPLHINGIDFPVPCGRCEACLKRKTSDWALRIESLSKKYVSFFFTLTYTEKDVPRNCFGDRVVCRKDITDFLKRFRQNLVRHIDENFKIKYFICSEYGPNKTNRPHYHGLIFVDRSYYYRLVLEQFKSTPSKFDKFFAKELFDSWGHCIRAAFDFVSLSTSDTFGKLTQYISKYFTYGKFLPEWMYLKASALFLDHYNRIHPHSYGFALDNQHNIDSFATRVG